MSFSDLLDVDTWARVRKSAPKVTEVPCDAAVSAIRMLEEYSSIISANTDLNDKKYWEASLKELLAVGHLEIKPFYLGRALRSMGLTLFRMADGYHAAWSVEQFEILKRYFNKEDDLSGEVLHRIDAVTER